MGLEGVVDSVDAGQVERGRRLRELREARGLKKEHVALAVGVGASNVGHYETGRSAPSVVGLLRIADLFEMTPSELMAALCGGPVSPGGNARDCDERMDIGEHTDTPDCEQLHGNSLALSLDWRRLRAPQRRELLLKRGGSGRSATLAGALR